MNGDREGQKEVGITEKKETNLSEWYQQVVLKSGLGDYSPVKGCMVYLPWGYAIWEEIRNYLDKKLKALGHRNAYFPLFIPESLLKKEEAHFEGFTAEVAWVNTEGEERLAIRPTSETIMYNMFSSWIKSYRDLPLLLNQWNNVVRWETKSTKLFLRTREFLWQEGHTVHATKEEADREVFTILELYKNLLSDLLAIPVLSGLKSEGEKFAGALYTATIEAMMPDGRALQAGTSHNLGQNFAKAFDIVYLDSEQKKNYAWQTSWGVSTRLIGAIVMVHGDDKGLVLPPHVAPVQVVIVPIYYSEGQRKGVTEACGRLRTLLENKAIRVEIDLRDDKTPGWKFNEWELKGVPIRMEVGPRDLERSSVVLYRRDTSEKFSVKVDEVEQRIPELLGIIHANMLSRAEMFLRGHITDVTNYATFRQILDERGGFLKAPWCAEPECESAIKDETGATVRLIPLHEKQPESLFCFKCGKTAKVIAYFARSY